MRYLQLGAELHLQSSAVARTTPELACVFRPLRGAKNSAIVPETALWSGEIREARKPMPND